jgi:CO/xanthine dehydrogenase FAD-binding subunit
MLPSFDYHRVQTPSEAVELLTAHKGKAKVLAGGTDLILQMEWGRVFVQHLVSMRDVTALKYIRLQEETILLGANTTHGEVERSTLVKRELAALHDAVCKVGSAQVRNVGTVAGNICSAAPSADTAAPLLALSATVRVLGPRCERMIAMADFYRGPGRSVLEPDEVLLEIMIPRASAYSGSAYFKFAQRNAMDLALIGVAAHVCTTPDKSHIKEARIALATAAPTPIRVYETEKLLQDRTVCEKTVNEAAIRASIEASPRSSFRSTSDYRREMIQVFVRRALLKALERTEI